MTMMRAMKLMPTLEPNMAAVSDLHWEKESQAQTVTLIWEKEPRAGDPASITCTVTAYWPSSSSTREWSRAWVSGGRGEENRGGNSGAESVGSFTK